MTVWQKYDCMYCMTVLYDCMTKVWLCDCMYCMTVWQKYDCAIWLCYMTVLYDYDKSMTVWLYVLYDCMTKVWLYVLYDCMTKVWLCYLTVLCDCVTVCAYTEYDCMIVCTIWLYDKSMTVLYDCMTVCTSTQSMTVCAGEMLSKSIALTEHFKMSRSKACRV